jgi:hypothetical protein
MIGECPEPDNLTLLADNLHKAFVATATDKSDPSLIKDELANFFKRR